MSKTITVQRYDNNIQLFFHITNNGVIEPIPNAQVYLKLKNKETGQQYKRRAEIVDAELAECKYVLTRKDLETVGVFDTEIETHYPNGTVLSTLQSPMTLVVSPEIVDQDGHFEDGSSTEGRQMMEERPPQRRERKVVEERPPQRRERQVVEERPPQRRERQERRTLRQQYEEPSVVQFL